MVHGHNIVEEDSAFLIDTQTRAVTYQGEKAELLIQYDHNSERFTFRMPRHVEGHDMMSSDRVEIHFVNTANARNGESSGVYYVNDIKADVSQAPQPRLGGLKSEEQNKRSDIRKRLFAAR